MKAMKIKGICIFITVMLILVTAVSEGGPPQAPKIEMASVLHNYGEVMQGERIVHAFTIRNEGTADLTIEKASPD